MKVKWKTKKTKFPEMEQNCAELNGKRVQVGVLGGGEAAWLAGIHEYGCVIPVTPKMRAYLHHNGLHLKNSTTQIKIPERAFLRNGYDEKKDEVVSKSEKVLGDVVGGTMSADVFLQMVGLMLSTGIKTYARNLNSPANHPYTVERKGSSNPLVDSGSMIGAIDYKVE